MMYHDQSVTVTSTKFFFFSSRRRHTRLQGDWSSDVCSSDPATRAPLLSNAFMRVKHVSLFEAVKLGAEVEDRSQEQMPIQKIMSVPVAPPEGSVMGVVQISRKGLDASLAGADFTNDDLKQLEQAAEILARMPFMQEGAEIS